jgi:6-hydroxynicotinate 3-monooxygenase
VKNQQSPDRAIPLPEPREPLFLPELAQARSDPERAQVSIAVVGAGLGGTTLAAFLLAGGYSVVLYEQAPVLAPLGAGIHLGPNIIKALRALGLEQSLLSMSNLPDAWVSRSADTGETLFRLPFDSARYGAPYVTIHRGKFHQLIVGLVPDEHYQLNKRLAGLEEKGNGVKLAFEDGTHATADIVIGADGLNSKVREILIGPELPSYTGNVSYRAQYPTALLPGLRLDDVTKWWGADRSVMVYFFDWRREEIYFVADVPEPEWGSEKSFVTGDVEELRAAFRDCCPDLKAIIQAAPDATKWGMFERKPHPLWSRGRIVLLGDACHPMRPHMGQGAAMAMEDGTILARCLLANPAGAFAAAFEQYEDARRDRASAVQVESSRNRWLKSEMDPLWVYGYDPVHVDIGACG